MALRAGAGCRGGHNTDADPKFIYANRCAQTCFEYSWDELIGLPSRLSAEAPERAERQALLDAVAKNSFMSGYRGIRVAKSGRLRFGMFDMFLGMIIVGIISAILGSAWRTPLMLVWQGMLVSAACLTVVSVSAACFVLLRAPSILLVVAMGLSIGVSATVVASWALLRRNSLRLARR